MEKNNFILYKNWKTLIDKLSIEQKGKLLQAIYDYVCGNGTDEVLEKIKNSLDEVTQMVFIIIQDTLHNDLEKYRKKCEKNKENVANRWNNKNTNVYERIRKDTNVKVGKKKNTNYTDIDIDMDIDMDMDIDNKDINNKKPSKHKYGAYKNVLLSDKEYQTLTKDYPNTEELINYLDSYMEDRPDYAKKHKSHYRCIENWVVEAVEEKKKKKGKDIVVEYNSNVNKPLTDEELKSLKEFRQC